MNPSQVYTRAIRGIAEILTVPLGEHDYVCILPDQSEGVLFHPRVGRIYCVCGPCTWNRSVDRITTALGAPPPFRSDHTLSQWVEEGRNPLPLA